jgi:hypothetical protein
MSERDETTTSESFGSRRRAGSTASSEAATTSSEAATREVSEAAAPPVDVSAIEASVATIREHATGLPNSDELAAVLAAVEQIEAALPVIAQGLADITASLESA